MHLKKLCIVISKTDILQNRKYHLNLACQYEVEYHPTLTHLGKSENTI